MTTHTICRTLAAVAGAMSLAVGCATTPSDPDSSAPTDSQVAPEGPRAVDVSVGGQHACAVLENGRIYCWGDNTYGQLGDGTTDERFEPVEVSAIDDATKVAAGAIHTCAIHADETVSCWGYAGDGRTAQEPQEPQPTPARVGAPGRLSREYEMVREGRVTTYRYAQQDCPDEGVLSGVTDIAAGLFHTCVVAEGQVYCWGSNERTTSSSAEARVEALECPLRVDVGGVATATDASFEYTCASVESGDVRCWAEGAIPTRDVLMGRLMRGFSQYSVFPVVAVFPFHGELDAVDVAVTNTFACDREPDGRVLCWGRVLGVDAVQRDDGRQFGQVTGIEAVRSIDGGGETICAATEAGRVVCIGVEPAGLIAGETYGVVELPGIDDARRVSVGSGVRASDSGYATSRGPVPVCAIDADGRVFCIGMGQPGRPAVDGAFPSGDVVQMRFETPAGAALPAAD